MRITGTSPNLFAMSDVIAGQAVSATLEITVTRANGLVEETIIVECAVPESEPKEA